MSSTNWADFAEDEDGDLELQVELPERTETPVDAKGIKKVTFFERKEDGTVIKVTQRVKVIELRQKTPLRTLERKKKWKAFGKGPEDGVTYLSAEEIFMQTPQEDEDEEKQDDFAQTVLDAVAQATIRTSRGVRGPASGGAEKSSIGSASADTSRNTYKPPKPAGYVAGSSGMPMRGPDDQPPALRVSNISAQATKDDIYQLFQPFGRIARVFLAEPPRGYAFVTFANEADGTRAKEALNGYGYAHLILKVEWAKPSTNRPQSSMRHASGYGKSLPQDNEKSTK